MKRLKIFIINVVLTTLILGLILWLVVGLGWWESGLIGLVAGIVTGLVDQFLYSKRNKA